MPVIDLSADPSALSAVQDCDICVIGSGPAGSTIARELAGFSGRVVILESGGLDRTDFKDGLNEIENVGRPRHMDQWGLRNRILGGSSTTWGGRCAPFDDIDFEPREWVSHSGWPFRGPSLVPYLNRSASYLGLKIGSGYTDDHFWALSGLKRPSATVDEAKLRSFFWQFSQDGESGYRYEYMRFGKRVIPALSPQQTLIIDATVLQIVPNPAGDSVKSVEFATAAGTHHALRAKIVVLCGGGIENARLLLASNRIIPNGLGNERDLVGRYLMDHPRGPVGTFDIPDPGALQRRFGRYNVGGHLFRAGLRLSPDIQRSENLINCAAWLGEQPSDKDPLDAIKRIVSGRAKLGPDIATVIANTPMLVRGAYDYFVKHNGLPRKLASLTLDVMSEQIPDYDSRITLSDRRDELDMPLSRIDWRVHPEESRSFRRMAQLAAEQLPRLGLPAPHLAEWVLDGAEMPVSFTDVGHPIGTTRMSDDPSTGVVDAQGEVHGVRGLFVCGTSTFPTAAHANPTQMVVAMALRLADHLKARSDIQVRATAPKEKASVTVEANPQKKVLVTGATGRIGRYVTEAFQERGYSVVATTSKPAAAGQSLSNIEFRQVNFAESVDFDALVRDCDAVAHLAADLGNMEVMDQVNAGTTKQLTEAVERAGIKSFCYVSTVSIYGSGDSKLVPENARTLTVDRDIPSEYWALDYVRMYGRTKLLGEKAIENAAHGTHYVIFRPTVVVSVDEIVDIRNWSYVKRLLGAHRNSHHVFVRDVADAVVWATERGLGTSRSPGKVEIFNLSEDEHPDPHHASFLQKAYRASGDTRYRVPRMPGVFDWLHDFLRFRTLPLRYPLWRMRFPNSRLREAGFAPRFGMDHAYSAALDQLARERDSRVLASGRDDV